MPRVSVIIPVRKANPRWLREAVDSMLGQTLADIEILIVEDSPASAPAIHDPRVRHLESVTPGLGPAINLAIAHAAAPLIARLDSDDVAEADRLAKQVAMFDADPDLAVAGSQLTVIDDRGVPFASRSYPTSHAAIVRAMQRYNAIAHPAAMFRKDVIAGAGGYGATAGEDYDLWCRLAVAGARFANHPEALVRYRFHQGLTQANVRRALRATIEIKRRHFGAALSWRARLRLLGERILLILPPRVVSALFRLTQLRTLPRREERGGGRSS